MSGPGQTTWNMTCVSLHDLELLSRRHIAGLSCHWMKLPGSPHSSSGLNTLMDSPQEYSLVLLSGTSLAGSEDAVLRCSQLSGLLWAGTGDSQVKKGKDLNTQKCL